MNITIFVKRYAGNAFQQIRFASGLKEIVAELIPCEQEKVKNFRKEHGKVKVGDITVNSVYGGMRGMLGLICETSLVDQNEGVRFRNLSILECQKKLPKAEGGEEPLPEGIFWLMVTGQVPTTEQVRELSCELAQQAELPKYINVMLDSLPQDLHPMAQLSSAVTTLSYDSKFLQSYSKGVNKSKYWELTFDDSITLLAKLPQLAAQIYNRRFRGGLCDVKVNLDLDWTANFLQMAGFEDPKFLELMRLYMTIHCDHEGGNVSAHTNHLVASALSNPFLSYAAGVNGLAGPLHGLANEEVLKWLLNLKKEMGDKINEDKLKEYVQNTLKAGKVVPGYGHAVLRKTDPRYTVQREFALKHLPDDELFKLVSAIYKVVPPILQGLGKVQNPWPNVDAHSGVMLYHYGMKEMEFYTVLFAISRCYGMMATLIWDRALGFPIERPKSITTDALIQLVEKINSKK